MSVGYNIRNKQGQISKKKYINDLDYSLDLIKLREIYEKLYRRTDFGFFDKNIEYTQHIINVNFDYSIKEYNQIRKGLYVKNGYNLMNFIDKIDDCVYVENGHLIAIQTNKEVSNAIGEDLLGKYFSFEMVEIKRGKRKGQTYYTYKSKQNIRTVMSVEKIRDALYENGFLCDGIKYVKFKRSSGSSRVGKCLFINESFYTRMHKWDMCGIKIKEGDEIDLAAIEPYIALTLSSIIDTIEIFPENILLIDDYISTFSDDMISVTENDKHQIVAKSGITEISNSIWDGQALLDSSMFGDYSDNGCILLRGRFFKSCAFNCNLQQFFDDNGIREVSQLNGKTIAKSISDIKLVTTPSSIKYLKFGTFKSWLKNIDNTFGIVKTDKQTKFFDGRLVAAHYQLLNTLQLSQEETHNLLKSSLKHLNLLKTDPSVLRYHIKYPSGKDCEFPYTALENRNDIVYQLLGLNEGFTETKLYADFRGDLTKSFSSKLKSGKILVNGNYQILLGNPMEMLLATIGKFDGVSSIKPGTIHTTRFNYGQELLGSRSPHIAAGNVWRMRNDTNPSIDLYFNLTPEIVCLNSINENVLERLAGADFDVDSALITDNPILISAADKNYDYFKVPTNLISSIKSKYHYTLKDMARLDHKTSENLIGDIVNLSQELNSIMWDKLNKGGNYKDIEDIYLDISILSVLSNCAIDAAKRERAINIKQELNKIKKKHRLVDKKGRQISSKFFIGINKQKGYYVRGKKCYKDYDTTMDYLYNIVENADRKTRISEFKPFSSILNRDSYNWNHINYSQIDRVVNLINTYKQEHKAIWANKDVDDKIKRDISNNLRQKYVDYIDKIKFNYHTMYYLLELMDKKENKHISGFLFKTLFGTPNKDFYQAIRQSKTVIPTLYEVTGNRYDVELYGFKFAKIIE